MITRRRFLQYVATTAGMSMLPLGGSAFALAAPQLVERRLVVIFLRGAADGLSVVVPYKDPGYYAHRTSIAIAPPGQKDGALDLDGFFGLHPSLGPLMPYWKDHSLAFVHASGFPSNLRSHFEAQDVMETASPDLNHSHTGWMNALARALPDTHSPTRALSFSNSLPRIFSGPFPNVATVPNNLKPDNKATFEDPKVEREFDMLYAHDKRLRALYEEGKNSRDTMIADLKKEMTTSGKGAPLPDGFPGQAARLATMIRGDQSIQLAFIDLGGWDTHVDQGGAKGQLANRLEKLGEGLATLASGLGAHYPGTCIMVISEFGRTVAQNGNGGTDHGHGNVVWLMGGGVRGGKVWGHWPGLGQGQLFENRDLDVTTDFRSIAGTVLKNHMGLNDARVKQVLAGDYPAHDSLTGLIG